MHAGPALGGLSCAPALGPRTKGAQLRAWERKPEAVRYIQCPWSRIVAPSPSPQPRRSMRPRRDSPPRWQPVAATWFRMTRVTSPYVRCFRLPIQVCMFAQSLLILLLISISYIQSMLNLLFPSISILWNTRFETLVHTLQLGQCVTLHYLVSNCYLNFSTR